eukprot:3533581-Prymnesium_polylepis.1
MPVRLASGTEEGNRAELVERGEARRVRHQPLDVPSGGAERTTKEAIEALLNQMCVCYGSTGTADANRAR